jgi:glutathione S-transferase
MRWALAQHDPGNWLDASKESERLIQRNDGEFKYYLDRYKYADRYPEFPESYYRSQGEKFLADLESKLSQTRYLSGSHFSIVDATIFPFIRQFAAVDSQWFQSSEYRHLNKWLNGLLASDLFVSVMGKYPVWNAGFIVS